MKTVSAEIRECWAVNTAKAGSKLPAHPLNGRVVVPLAGKLAKCIYRAGALVDGPLMVVAVNAGVAIVAGPLGLAQIALSDLAEAA